MQAPFSTAAVFLVSISTLYWQHHAVGQSASADPKADSATPDVQVISADGIYRLWLPPEGSAVAQPLPDYEHLLTDSARQVRESNNASGGAGAASACGASMPMAMLSQTPIKFVRGEETITLELPARNANRLIHMENGRDLEPPSASSPLGYSIGYWDHDVLVVETTHLDASLLDAAGTPLSDQTKFIERFSVTADDSHLAYKLTTIDRVMFKGPITFDRQWDWAPGAQSASHVCGPNQKN
jgi:hypothetical protein